MTDLLATAEAFLASVRETHFAAEVTLRRGASERSGVIATQGNTRAENVDQDGLSVRSKIVDFLIPRAEYRITATLLTPTLGDQIVRADGVVFEVAEFGSEPCFRNHDRAGNTLRIHTKEIGAE